MKKFQAETLFVYFTKEYLVHDFLSLLLRENKDRKKLNAPSKNIEFPTRLLFKNINLIFRPAHMRTSLFYSAKAIEKIIHKTS